MPTSTSRLAYPDCEKFLDAALADELGARLPFEKPGQARQFVVRANNYRAICRRDNARIYPERDDPLHGRSEYDPLRITVEGPDAAGDYWVYARKVDTMIAEIEPISDSEGVADVS